jgi:hypothetical protein
MAAHAQGKVIASNDEWFTQALGSTRADDHQLLQNALDWFALYASASVPSYSSNGSPANAGYTSFLTSLNLSPVITSTESESNFSNAFGLGYTRLFQGIAGNGTMSALAGQEVYAAALFQNVSSVFVNNGNGVVYSTAVVSVRGEAFAGGDHDVSAIAQVTATPEPASLALIATGLFGLIPVILRRRRQG